MAQSEEAVQAGQTYQVELEGVVVGEFSSDRSRRIAIEGLGGADCFVSKLPAHYDETRDKFSARPRAPLARFRNQAQKYIGDNWGTLLRQPAGVYFVRYADLGEIRIELDQGEED